MTPSGSLWCFQELLPVDEVWYIESCKIAGKMVLIQLGFYTSLWKIKRSIIYSFYSHTKKTNADIINMLCLFLNNRLSFCKWNLLHFLFKMYTKYKHTYNNCEEKMSLITFNKQGKLTKHSWQKLNFWDMILFFIIVDKSIIWKTGS